MNRFRTKKRAKDDLATGRSSEDGEQSSLSFKGFRKGKKVQQEETKIEIDLANALPSNDDFRTSLLMANLSARFSMLREQDDPNTKIGKASDDSVLFPKRQSRMAEFGFGTGASGLTDIAEVESIKGQGFVRNSSASNDADAGTGGSVMERGRPTEGNILFGGRQKIYKIPAGAGGALSGRALYEDDVALSSFQRWRQAEKERSLEETRNAESESAEEEAEQTRSTSPPPVGYNRKRETSSTTSSASTMARNSTAATSVTSQTAKDGQSTPTSSANTPANERSVARTRRLYEQGLIQDIQEQQASASSRIESLTRQRPFGTRTPDLSTNSTSQAEGSAAPSNTNHRTVMTKASAPNSRAASPSANGHSVGPMNLGSLQTDTKPKLGGVPPLSPPISEVGEQPILSGFTKDSGKATSVFDRPSQPYDESQYRQLQLQLQQGRETPTQRHGAESNSTTVSRSKISDAKSTGAGTQSAVHTESLPPTPATDSETPPSIVRGLAGLSLLPEVSIERPADEDHPAFRRQSAMPTPLHIGAKAGRDPSPGPKPTSSVEQSQTSSEDSPTLGPGLSGLVRQHLRTESVDSSVSGMGLDASAPEPRTNPNPAKPAVTSDQESRLSPWSSPVRDRARSRSANSPEPTLRRPIAETRPKEESSDLKIADRHSNHMEDETDEFASQLADARRRVREKLTSFVESDSSRASSPLPSSESPNLTAHAPANPLGIGILKPKSSKGSLIDRSRNIVTGQSKGIKILGIGGSTTNTPPQSAKQSFDEKEIPVLETMKEEVVKEEPHSGSRGIQAVTEVAQEKDVEDTTHPGLRAFRQARRELQKRKELETLARHQASNTAHSPEQTLDQATGAQSSAWTDRAPRQRTPSRERRPPPVTYRHRAPSEERGYGSVASARPSGERDRSGSETSGGRSNSRPPPRVRTNTNTGPNPGPYSGPHSGPYSGPHEQQGPSAFRQPMARSPGLPGTDIKGSPIMPPHPYPNRGAPSPAASPRADQSRTGGSLAVHTGRPGLDPHSGQPSPVSPMGLPSPSPVATGSACSPAGTPTSLGPRPRGASASQSPAMDPGNGAYATASRAPAAAMPHQAPQSHYPPPPQQAPPMIPGMGDNGRPYGGTRSRSNSRTQAPPVPPINPRRRREDSRARPPHEDAAMAAPRPPFAKQANNSSPSLGHEENRSAFSVSEDESGNKLEHQRRRLRKPPPPDMQGAGQRPMFPPRSRENSPPFAVKEAAMSNRCPNTGMDLPGGMI
ncbi:hypothetical protein VTK26DRAFT_8585 [Humicola hyalothermophila]